MELLLVEMAGSTKVNFQCDRLLFFCLLLTLWGQVNQTSMYKTEGLPGFWGDLPPPDMEAGWNDLITCLELPCVPRCDQQIP